MTQSRGSVVAPGATFMEKLKARMDNGDITVWLMILPTIVLFCATSLYPFIWIFRYVFYDYNGFNAYPVGWYNFERLFRDSTYWTSVLNTFEYAGLKLVLVLPLALALPDAFAATAAAVVLLQTLVELVAMVTMVRLVPRWVR